MSETKTKVIELKDSDNESVFVINSAHTIADIMRWLIDQNYMDEIETMREIERENKI